MKKIKKYFSSIDFTKVLKWLVPLMLIVFLLLFFKKILVFFGLAKSADEKEAEQKNSSAATAALDELKSRGIRQNLTDDKLLSICNAVYQDLDGSMIFRDYDDAEFQLTQFNNDADIYRAIQLFGMKQDHTLFKINYGQPVDFRTFVTTNLMEFRLNSINKKLKQKGVNYGF